MHDPIQERLNALTQANLRILHRLDEIERRLRSLEAGAGVVPAPNSQDDPASVMPVDPPQAAVEPETSPAAPPPPPPAPPAPVHPASGTLETTVGLNWVNRIGALTLLIGVAFFFKYAIDNEWIGPAGRILAGVLAGGALTAYGYRSWRRGHSVFAQGITAAGVATLYLSFWAAFSLYGLIQSWLALALMLAATALAGSLAVLFHTQAMAWLGLIGGWSAPLLLSRGDDQPWFFALYGIAINAAWLALARRMNWSLVERIAAVLTLLIGAGFLEGIRRFERGPVGGLFLTVQYLLFLFSPVAVLRLAGQVFCGAGVGIIWGPAVWAGTANCLGILAAGLLAAGRFFGWKAQPLAALAGFALGHLMLWSGASMASGLPPLLLSATLAFALLCMSGVRSVLGSGGSPAPLDLMMLVLPGAVYLLQGLGLLSGDREAWRGLFTAGLAAAYAVLGWILWRRQENQTPDARPVLFCAGAGLALLTVAVALQFYGFRITILWAMEAAGLAWLAARYRLASLRNAMLAVALLVAVRLALIDAVMALPAAAGPYLNVRFLTMLASAACLGLAAWWTRPSPWALPPYLAAHAALLGGILREHTDWVRRAAPAAEQLSSILTGMSLLAGLYGLGLVFAGVWTRTKLNRLLGLALLAVVVVKLYAADVWTMSRLHRILAFSALGALLLATSFFYTRFRARIESWVKADDAQRS